MTKEAEQRRTFLKQSLSLGAALAGPGQVLGQQRNPPKLFVTCHEFSWRSYCQRDGRDFFANLNDNLSEIAKAGFNGFEPRVLPRDHLSTYIDRLMPLLRKHNLEMRSINVFCNLHDPERSKVHVDRVKNLVEKCQEEAGTKIVVLQPVPLKRELNQCKTDEQLKYQAEQVDRLGAQFAAMGLKAAYHNLEPEFACAAREFHHMFAATQPENLSFCLDADRIYRGTGKSQVALLDIVNLYGSRVSEVHFRQSNKGIWSESFDTGDLDYAVICQALAEQDIIPHLVYEQAYEPGSPKTMTPLDAHTKGRTYLHQLCASAFTR